MKKILKKFFGNTFSGERFVNSYLANIFGLQILRYFFGKIMYNLKFIYLNKKKTQVENKGYILIENFLSEDDFNKILDETHHAVNDNFHSKEYNDYGNGVEAKHVYLDEKIKSIYPKLYEISTNEKINNLFCQYELRNNVNIVAKFEGLTFKDSENDLSKNYHYDTYFNTFKAWYFLQDVSLDNGPLNFVDFSHKFSFRRAIEEWLSSIKYSLLKDKKDWKTYGSSAKNFSYYEKNSTKFFVKKNTFLFANTHALHRRGDSKPNMERNTIHFYTRESPFKIFFN
tara:strand:- start:13593 stop:14444 length:852 start_codon:yes stop_codon:yes gene_type:complete